MEAPPPPPPDDADGYYVDDYDDGAPPPPPRSGRRRDRRRTAAVFATESEDWEDVTIEDEEEEDEEEYDDEYDEEDDDEEDEEGDSYGEEYEGDSYDEDEDDEDEYEDDEDEEEEEEEEEDEEEEEVAELRPEHLEEMRTIFVLLDTDLDGKLDSEQLCTAITATGLTPSRRIVRELHNAMKRKEGVASTGVDFDTFLDYVTNKLKAAPLSLQGTRDLFRHFDPFPPTGYVSGRHLAHVLSEVANSTHLTEDELTSLFHELDIVDSDSIDYIELARTLSSGYVALSSKLA